MFALPPTIFLVFLELAVGGAAVLLWADWRRELSRGFLLLTAIILWLCAALALWVREGFPLTALASPWRALETPLVVAHVALLLVYVLLVWRRVGRGQRLALGLATGAGVAALGAAALVHAGAWGSLVTWISLLLGALSLGGAMVGMLLGHWYLVTPNLSTRPLLGLTGAFLGAAAVQGLLLPLQLGFLGGAAEGLGGAATLLDTYSIAFVLRVLVGILFPVVLGVMTWQTCRLRSMMSATGLLYIAVSCVLAGEVAAKTLFFLTGIPT